MERPSPDNVLLVDKKNQTAPNHVYSVPKFNLDSTDLTSTEKSQLCSLLTEFADLFTCKGGCVISQTPPVKHTIVTEGPAIRQPIRRLPEALKSVVSDEVEKMLEQGVLRPSNSPWSSPIVMV